MLVPALVAAIAMAGAMAAAAHIAERTRRSGFIDGLWTLATGATALFLMAAVATRDGGIGGRVSLVGGLILVWALRLGGHLLRRTAASRADDPRYARLRREWGDEAPRRMLLFLQGQAVAGWLLALAAAAASRPGPLSWMDALGALFAIAGLAGEGAADRTLAAFRRRAATGVCADGVWGWSRHPNYFFEWVFWLGIGLIGVSFTEPSLRTVLSLLAPLEMYWLLAHVSGVPPLERHMLDSRGEAYRAYQRRVPPFFPRPPKPPQDANQRDSAA